ncbi:hypothetical protein [Alistipes sp. AF48-12]|uniref:hypothetical protein n=1 Tax=Alistipes sp. AF48-12 TaxID=2291998 RepID=UPI0021752E7D|nr:hypothetical protein [Alistipes sp. AF48-12]
MSGKQKEHRRHGILLGVADGVVFLISVALAVLLMLAYAAPRVDPHDSLWFAYLGLAAPFLYLANLVLMLYWTVRWKWIAVGLAAVAVIGLGHVSKFFRPAFGKAYEQVRQPGSFRVLSYNVEAFSAGIRSGNAKIRLPRSPGLSGNPSRISSVCRSSN